MRKSTIALSALALSCSCFLALLYLLTGRFLAMLIGSLWLLMLASAAVATFLLASNFYSDREELGRLRRAKKG